MKSEQNRIIYGYTRNAIGKIEAVPLEVSVVNIVFQAYLDGNSLGKISELLGKMNVLSPSGKAVWGRQLIDNLISNEKYVGNEVYPQIISKELFNNVQQEKKQRSTSTGRETSSRYSSAHPLSGLIVCGECGRKYRRYMRTNGTVVWRCANRIEHGSEICKSSPAISEDVLKTKLAAFLENEGQLIYAEQFDYLLRDTIGRITIQPNGDMSIEFKQGK